MMIIRKRGTVSGMRRVSSTGQGTYILDDLHSTPRNAILAKEVIAEAQKIVEMGYNARFSCENKLHQKAVEDRLKENAEGYKTRIYAGSEYDLACQVIQEAKKIVGMAITPRSVAAKGNRIRKSERKGGRLTNGKG